MQDDGAVWNAIAEPRSPPTAVLQREDGSATWNLNEIHQLIRDAWSPVYCRWKGAEACMPTPEQFLEEYREELEAMRYECPIRGTTGAGLHKAIARMNAKSACSADGWRVQEGRRIHDGFHHIWSCRIGFQRVHKCSRFRFQ